MTLVDTSGLFAALDRSQRFHEQCSAALLRAKTPLLLSPFVLAELDYLLWRHIGPHAQAMLLEEVAGSVYRLEPFAASDIKAGSGNPSQVCRPRNRTRRRLDRRAGRTV